MKHRVSAILATLTLLLGGIVATAPSAHADTCGDTQASWIGSTSAWSGTAGSDAFTAVLAPPALGVQAAATVIVPTTGTGAWSYSDHIQWIASAAVWWYRFELSATACDGSGNVTAAEGARVDAFFNVVGASMTRTL